MGEKAFFKFDFQDPMRAQGKPVLRYQLTVALVQAG
jgi:hypothetical protein